MIVDERDLRLHDQRIMDITSRRDTTRCRHIGLSLDILQIWGTIPTEELAS
jgi:hypothetical protein